MLKKKGGIKKMVKKIMRGVALVAAALTIGGSILKAAVAEDTIWVYQDDNSTTTSPDCTNIEPNECAKEYFVIPGTTNPDLTRPVPGGVVFGTRNL